MLTLFLTILLSYIIGAIPTSIIVGKILRNIDIRNYGSGNAGGTNVFRVLGWKPGLFVMIFDAFKGFAATFWISSLGYNTLSMDNQSIMLISGCAAIFGHIWTVFAGFRGGKGVGTAAGMLIAIQPIALLICFAVFIIVFLITKIVSISSILAALAFPLVISIFRFNTDFAISSSLFYFSFFAAILLLFTHRSNIKRLLKGQENKFYRK